MVKRLIARFAVWLLIKLHYPVVPSPEEWSTDYTMLGEPGPGNSFWLTVETLSIHVKKGDEGVSITIYPLGHEDEDWITETWATYGEGEWYD